jgi:hypothetical protein
VKAAPELGVGDGGRIRHRREQGHADVLLPMGGVGAPAPLAARPPEVPPDLASVRRASRSISFPPSPGVYRAPVLVLRRYTQSPTPPWIDGQGERASCGACDQWPYSTVPVVITMTAFRGKP